MAEYVAGIDIGGTNIDVLVVDAANRAVGASRGQTATATAEALLDSVAAAWRTALGDAGVASADVAAVGVGVPGQVDPGTGDVRLAVNLFLHEFPLGSRLGARLNRPVVVENDVRLAAIGIYHHLAATAVIRHLAYFSVGTGVAAGIVLDGALYRGGHGLAGEIGHMTVEPAGPVCNCGGPGCLEALVAGPAILRQATAVWPAGQTAPRSVADVYAAAEAGHAVARDLVERVSAHLAHALYILTLCYDPDVIVLGGGVARAGAAFLQPVLRHLQQRCEISSLAQLLLTDEKIRLLPADFHAGARGAVWLARKWLAVEEVSIE